MARSWYEDEEPQIDVSNFGIEATEEKIKSKFRSGSYSIKGSTTSIFSTNVKDLISPLKGIERGQTELLNAFNRSFGSGYEENSLLGLTSKINEGIQSLFKENHEVTNIIKANNYRDELEKRKGDEDSRLQNSSKASLIREHEKKLKSQREAREGDNKNYLWDFIFKGDGGSGGIKGWVENLIPRELQTGFEWLKKANEARVKTKMSRQGMVFDEERGEYKHGLTWYMRTRQQLKDFKRKERNGELTRDEVLEYRKLQAVMKKEMPFYIEALQKAGLINERGKVGENLNKYAARSYEQGLKETRILDSITKKEVEKQSTQRNEIEREVRKGLLRFSFGGKFSKKNESGFLEAKNLWQRKIEGKGVLTPQYNGESWSTNPLKQGFTEKQGNILTKTLGKLAGVLKPGQKEKGEKKGLLGSLSTILMLKSLLGGGKGIAGAAISGAASILPGLAAGAGAGGLGRALMTGGRFLLTKAGPIGLAAATIYGAHKLNQKYDWSGKIAGALPVAGEKELEMKDKAINAPNEVPADERFKLARKEYLEWEKNAKNPSQKLREDQWTVKLKGYGFKDLDHTKVPIPKSKGFWSELLFGDSEIPDVIKSHKIQALSEERNKVIADDNAEKRVANEAPAQNVTNINAPVTNISSPNPASAPTVIQLRDTEPTFVQGVFGEQGAWNGP